MLLIGVLQLPIMTPPRAGTTCAYHSWSVPIVELNCLLGKPGDEPCMRGTIELPVAIQLTL
jgi:hypothetical protein